MSATLIQPNGDIPPEESVAATSGAGKKRLSVERIYQKKTQLEHILLRPDSYVGSTLKNTQTMWTLDQENNCMVYRDITFSPGLYKIFDEILVNAADNKVRDESMTCVKVDIKPEENMIRIWNNGKGIPIVNHKVENIYVPTLIFGHLLTSSNYDDSERKVTGGRNGYGAKLCNIFSKRFIVETSCKEYNKSFRQEWRDNMTKTSEPKITASKGEDYTCITFYPDLERFGMTELEPDTVALFIRRAYDLAASANGIRVFLNGTKLPIKNFTDYVNLFVKSNSEDSSKVVFESVSPRWQVAVTASSNGFQQVSFVNSIATTKGGKHVEYICDQLANKLMEIVKKKSGKTGVQIKPFQIKNHMWIFVNCLIENPTFDSQTKECMTLLPKSFGSTCTLSEKFVSQASKCGIVESVLSWVRFKAMEKMDKQCHKAKHAKIKGIPKLDDANNAGTKNSPHCTLILTEGDSAKSLAVAGLGVVGRDNYGVFPLRGKLLNVREASSKQIMDNTEINALIKIMGLQYKLKYDSPETLKDLRYGKVMIMTDQDQDGSHIKGLIINFMHSNWPNLLKYNFIEEFITPIVKVFKGKQELPFYSLPEFEEWQKNTSNWHTWRIKYYKGLGTSTGKEAKEYFSDMNRHRIRFRYSGHDDDSSITLAFDKSKAADRKAWLTAWTEERKRRRELDLPEPYLYGKDTRAITYHDFVHKELVLFSNLDNERSIPSMVDGLKPGQRKVLFTCIKRNIVKEIKVAQLAGSVSELSAYHHGEQSLLGTIVGLAQNFVGSNNLNILLPIGQFGTRLSGGKDAASPRYIFTALSPLARLIFHPADDAILKYLRDDNLRIEPEWYAPIVPMVLINGTAGIGTGYATKIPNFDTHEVIANLYRMMDGCSPLPMLPSFRGFRGIIQELEDNRYLVHGEVAVLDEETVEITELPARVWTQNYKEEVLEPMLNGTEKVKPLILDYKEYHTDTTVRFVVRLSPEKLREAEATGLHKFFKLSATLTTNSMVLFDSLGCLKHYQSVADILKDFYELRLSWYEKRKAYLEGMFSAEARKLENQARFVMEKIDSLIVIENKPRKELIRMLKEANYDSDPVRIWKETLDKLGAMEERAQQGETESTPGGETTPDDEEDGSPDYNYILGMPLWSLTKERKDDLLSQRDAKRAELRNLLEKTAVLLWREDLKVLEDTYTKLEQQLMAEEEHSSKVAAKKSATTSKVGGGVARAVVQKGHVRSAETKPDPYGRRITPVVDPDMLKKLEVGRKRRIKAGNAGNNAEAKEDAIDLDDDDDGFDDGFSNPVPKPLFSRLSGDGEFALPQEDTLGVASSTTAVGRGRGRGSKVAAGATRRIVTVGGRKRPSDGGDSNKSPGKKNAKATKQKKPWDSDSDEDDDKDGSESSFDGPTAADATVSPSRQRVRRVTAKAKYTFDDSDEDESDRPDEEEFKIVDHGQGDRALDVPVVEITAAEEEAAIASASTTPTKPSGTKPAPTEAAPVSRANESAPSRGRARGRGRGAGPRTKDTGVKPSRWTTAGNAAKKQQAGKKPKKAFSDESDLSAASSSDDSVGGGGAGPADNPGARNQTRAPRMNARRTATERARYVFDLESSGEEVDDDAVDMDSDSGGAKVAAAAGRVKKRTRSESDDDFEPGKEVSKKPSKKKTVFSDSDSDF